MGRLPGPAPEDARHVESRRMPVVIDTNIVLDLLLFDDAACMPLAAALGSGRLRWLATPAMREELDRVLGYPVIAARLLRDNIGAQAVMAAFDRSAELVAHLPPRAPCVCRDPDDQMFVDLAVAHRALLLSKDGAVRSMRKRLAAHGVEVMAVMPALAD